MPCYTVVRSKVELLATSTNPELLAKGLKALGYTVHVTDRTITFTKGYRTGTYDIKTGKLTMDATWNSAEIKAAYSKEVVVDQADRHGWKISWSTDEEGNEQAKVLKRG